MFSRSRSPVTANADRRNVRVTVTAVNMLIATPIDLRRVLTIDKPTERVRYELQEIGRPDLDDVLGEMFSQPSRSSS